MINDKFLDAFRALDTELKSDGTTVLDYENSLETAEQEKMKVCRIMRNYMSHNDTTFVVATNDQIKFLNEQIDNIKRKAHTVKDEMKRIKTLKATEPIKNILTQIVKYPIVPIETKIGLFLVDKDIILKQLAAGNKKIDIPTRLPKYNYVEKLERIENLISHTTYIVTEDGTATGKYLGIVIV